MAKVTKLYVDQYGTKYYSKTLRGLKEGYYLPGKVSKMYREKDDGGIVHVGYVIGQLWLTAYVPYEGV